MHKFLGFKAASTNSVTPLCTGWGGSMTFSSYILYTNVNTRDLNSRIKYTKWGEIWDAAEEIKRLKKKRKGKKILKKYLIYIVNFARTSKCTYELANWFINKGKGKIGKKEISINRVESGRARTRGRNLGVHKFNLV